MNVDHCGAARSRERAARIYALWLRLYPRPYRLRFGEQMLQTFRDQYREAVEREGQLPPTFWVEVVTDEGKSIAREHVAALSERRPSMRNRDVFAWKPLTIVAALALFVMLGRMFRSGDVGPFMLLAAPVYVALLFLVAGFARGFPQLHARRSWWRLGLVLGSVLGLYVTALNTLYALAPMNQGQRLYGGNPRFVWLMTLPLLAGVVGVLGGSGGGSMRKGVAAGLLAGGVLLCVNVLSTALPVLVLWNALQHGALHSYLQADTLDWMRHQWGAQHPGLVPDPWAYLTSVQDDSSAAFLLVFMSLFVAGVWPLPVIVGSAIGAQATRRANDTHRPETFAPPPSGHVRRRARGVGFAVLVLALGVALWSSYAIVHSAFTGGTFSRAFDEVVASYSSSTFLAWVLAFLLVVAASYVTVRPTARQHAIRVTGG